MQGLSSPPEQSATPLLATTTIRGAQDSSTRLYAISGIFYSMKSLYRMFGLFRKVSATYVPTAWRRSGFTFIRATSILEVLLQGSTLP